MVHSIVCAVERCPKPAELTRCHLRCRRPRPGDGHGKGRAAMTGEWQQTACILCECNCGVVVQLDGRRLAKIRGDKEHPASGGYTCNKALRLDHYQNSRGRL